MLLGVERAGYSKLAADARFNRAMILAELGKKGAARAEFTQARRCYAEMGDPPSVLDVDRTMQRLKL